MDADSKSSKSHASSCLNVSPAMLAEMLEYFANDRTQLSFPWNIRCLKDRDACWKEDFTAIIRSTQWSSYIAAHSDVLVTIDKFKQVVTSKLRDILKKMDHNKKEGREEYLSQLDILKLFILPKELNGNTDEKRERRKTLCDQLKLFYNTLYDVEYASPSILGTGNKFQVKKYQENIKKQADEADNLVYKLAMGVITN